MKDEIERQQWRQNHLPAYATDQATVTVHFAADAGNASTVSQ